MNRLRIFMFCIFCVVTIKGESESTRKCLTPRIEEGTCVPLRSCTILHDLYLSGNESSYKYVEQLACENGSLNVCCTMYPIRDSHRSNALLNLIPKKTYCGKQQTDDYGYTGIETSIDEFPWLVEISCTFDYQRFNDEYPGVLFSHRYVLTTRHCTGKNHTTRVTLGIYSRLTDVSCTTTKYNIRDCTVNVRFAATESLVSPNGVFVLLRLEEDVTFTDFIRPICLPFDRHEIPKINRTVVSSGWSRTDVYFTPVDIKQKLFYKIVPNGECNNSLPSKSSQINYLCARKEPQEQNTTEYCIGSAESPIMYKYKKNWFITGMLATPNCYPSMPFVVKQINHDTLDWILDTIRA